MRIMNFLTESRRAENGEETKDQIWFDYVHDLNRKIF